MNKPRIVFDNNILDKLIKCSIDELNLISNNYEVINCDTLIKECENIKYGDKKKYDEIKNILPIFKMKNYSVFGFASAKNPNPENVRGFSTKNSIKENCRMATLKSSQVYKKIHPNATAVKKEDDRQIA